MKKINHVFCLCGASGTGKSTILEHVSKNFCIDVQEVSARPYLPKTTDYVNSLDETSQTLITQHRFADILKGAFENKIPTLYSRSPLDSLAYEAVLNKAPFLYKLLEKQVEISKSFVHYIYLPVEFDMSDTGDVVRGTNQEVQQATDATILKAFDYYGIDYLELSGTKEERAKKLRDFFAQFHIYGAKVDE